MAPKMLVVSSSFLIACRVRHPRRPPCAKTVKFPHFGSLSRGGCAMLPPMQKELIESKLDYTFKSDEWLRRALTHPSCDKAANLAYERLEFLGDAVLELVVSTELFHLHAEADEGVLTKMRAGIVSRRHLAQLAAQLGWGEQLTMSSQLEKTGGRSTHSILANTFESIIGAVMMDSGYEAARRVSLHLLADSLRDAPKLLSDNPKGELQEKLQALGAAGPTYRVQQEEGMPPSFVATALWKEQAIGHGRASSKHKAEIAAAADALQRQLFHTPPA